MKRYVYAALLAFSVMSGSALADEATFKGRANTVGTNCRGNSWFEVEAKIVGDKVEGTLLGSAFRNPVKFSGVATASTFTAAYIFAQFNNLRVDITGARVDDQTWTVSTRWAGGGPSNCETSGPHMKV